jgi:hypothetical protein
MTISIATTLYSGTATESGNSYAHPVPSKYCKSGTFYLDITAASGTIDIVIEIWDSISKKWYLLATFTQQNSITHIPGFVQYGLGEKVACKYVISQGGSFTFAVTANLKEGI